MQILTSLMFIVNLLTLQGVCVCALHPVRLLSRCLQPFPNFMEFLPLILFSFYISTPSAVIDYQFAISDNPHIPFLTFFLARIFQSLQIIRYLPCEYIVQGMRGMHQVLFLYLCCSQNILHSFIPSYLFVLRLKCRVLDTNFDQYAQK